jgi:hypothetical protein
MDGIVALPVKKSGCEGASILEFTRRDAMDAGLPQDHQHIIGLLPTHYEDDMPDYSIDRYHFALTNQQINGNWVYVCKYKNPDGTFATFNSTVQPDDHIVGLMLDAGLSSFSTVPRTASKTSKANITVLKEIEWDYPQHLYGGFSIYTAGSNVQNPHMWKNPYDGFDNKYVNFAYEEMAGNLQPEVNDPSIGATALYRSAELKVMTLWNFSGLLNLLQPSPTNKMAFFLETILFKTPTSPKTSRSS